MSLFIERSWLFSIRNGVCLGLFFLSSIVLSQDPTHRLGFQASPILGLDHLAIREVNSSEATYGNDFVPLIGVKYEYKEGNFGYGGFLGAETIGLTTGFSIDNQHSFKFGKDWYYGSLSLGYMYRKNFRFNADIYHHVIYSAIGFECRIIDRILIEPQGCFGYILEKDDGFSAPNNTTTYLRPWFRINIAYLFKAL